MQATQPTLEPIQVMSPDDLILNQFTTIQKMHICIALLFSWDFIKLISV